MRIPVTFALPSDSSPKLPPALARISNDEVVLIELQGSLEVEPGREKEKAGKLVGNFRIDDQLTKPTLMIGHHLLEGKVVNLPKPIAVIHRREKYGSGHDAVEFEPNVDEGNDTMAVDNYDGGVDAGEPMGEGTRLDKNTTGLTWHAVAIVKRKIVFSKRPMPIVGKPK